MVATAINPFFSESQEAAIDAALAPDLRYLEPKSIPSGEDKKIRFFGQPITGKFVWLDPEPGSDKGKPVYWEVMPKELPSNIQLDTKTNKPKAPTSFVKAVVWDYDEEMFRILTITQKGLLGDLKKYYTDEDWGDPRNYNVKIGREEAKPYTKYTFTPSSKSKVSQEIQDKWNSFGSKINLNAIYDNNNPYEDCPDN